MTQSDYDEHGSPFSDETWEAMMNDIEKESYACVLASVGSLIRHVMKS